MLPANGPRAARSRGAPLHDHRRDALMSRIAPCVDALRGANRAAFVAFIAAADPDLEPSFAILGKAPPARADISELGVPFSDPMAVGPAIEASSLRALQAGMRVKGTLALVERFRR